MDKEIIDELASLGYNVYWEPYAYRTDPEWCEEDKEDWRRVVRAICAKLMEGGINSGRGNG